MPWWTPCRLRHRPTTLAFIVEHLAAIATVAATDSVTECLLLLYYYYCYCCYYYYYYCYYCIEEKIFGPMLQDQTMTTNDDDDDDDGPRNKRRTTEAPAEEESLTQGRRRKRSDNCNPPTLPSCSYQRLCLGGSCWTLSKSSTNVICVALS